MITNSGYQIVRLGALKTSGPVTVPGVYEAIEGAYKALLFTHVEIDDVDYRPVYTDAALVMGDYVITVYGFKITIAADDEVSVVKI